VYVWLFESCIQIIIVSSLFIYVSSLFYFYLLMFDRYYTDYNCYWFDVLGIYICIVLCWCNMYIYVDIHMYYPHHAIKSIPETDMLFLCRNSESFHLDTGGVSRFTTQNISWTGSFRTFIVHGRRTAPERVRKRSELDGKWNRRRFADNLTWKFHLFLSKPVSARFAKVTVKWVYGMQFP